MRFDELRYNGRLEAQERIFRGNPSMTHRQSLAPGRRRTRAVVTTLAVGLLATGIAPVAVSQASANADTADAATTGHAGPEKTDETEALEEAASSGTVQEVLSSRTEVSRVLANPDGSFTSETYATPQWVRKEGALVDVDPSLVANADGTYSAAATEVGVTFSGGGSSDPLVTVLKNGREMSLTWPDALPEPVVEQNTITYREVLDGVDLKLAARNGGFSQILVVKSAEAAANPELRQVRFELDTHDLTVSTDEHGNIRAVNAAGQEVFMAPAPRMWDSKTPQDPVTARALASTTEEDAPPHDEFASGPGSRQADIAVDVDSDALSLTPDQELLTGPDTTYPVYLDPSVEGSRYSWTIAYKPNPNTSFFNGSGWNGGTTSVARVGHEDQDGGLGRSFFRMRTSDLKNPDRVIQSSTFRIKNVWSWSCSKREVQLWRTGTISSSTTWANQPSWHQQLDTVNDAKGWSSSCPAGNLAFDATQAAKASQTNGASTVTLGMKASNENDTYAWKKFDAGSAKLSTTYFTRPKQATQLDTYPVSTGCRTTPQYLYIGNTDFYLQARVAGTDGGSIKARFQVWPTGHYNGGAGVVIDRTITVPSGTIARTKITRASLSPHLGTANGGFAWRVLTGHTQTNLWASQWAPSTGTACHFIHDPNRPSNPPGISSVQFPDGSEGWPADTAQARTEGIFTLTNGGSADVTKYEWWTSADHTRRTATPSSAGGSVNVSYTPLAVGAQRLYAQSIDRAGNRSDATNYVFYAASPGEEDSPGDANGDGASDLYGVRQDGELRLYAGAGNGRVHVPHTIASARSFDGSLITSRGSWTDDGYEDLIAAHLQPDGTRTLTVHPNNGLGYACSQIGEEADGESQSCAMDAFSLQVYDSANNHWAQADQILAIGDVDGGLDTDGDGQEDVAGFPDLLVKEGDHLWLYFGSPTGYLDETREPELIGSSSWSTYDIAAPGDLTNDGRVDLIGRNRSNGRVYAYPGSGDDGQGLGTGPTRIELAQGMTPALYPLITSGADINNDGKPDLWSSYSEGTGHLRFYSGVTATGIGTMTQVGASGWLAFQALS
jgi:hypothetical protein